MKDDTPQSQVNDQSMINDPKQAERPKDKGQGKEIKKIETEMHQLKEELDTVKQQLEETKQQRMRAVADYQNQEKRFEKEKQEFVKYANATLLLRILDVVDNLDRAAGYIKDPGLSMVQKDMQAVLREFGVEEINVLGEPFDPNTMECSDKKPGKENLVLEVAEKGYRLADRILRPAKVVVGTEVNE